MLSSPAVVDRLTFRSRSPPSGRPGGDTGARPTPRLGGHRSTMNRAWSSALEHGGPVPAKLRRRNPGHRSTPVHPPDSLPGDLLRSTLLVTRCVSYSSRQAGLGPGGAQPSGDPSAILGSSVSHPATGDDVCTTGPNWCRRANIKAGSLPVGAGSARLEAPNLWRAEAVRRYPTAIRQVRSLRRASLRRVTKAQPRPAQATGSDRHRVAELGPSRQSGERR